MMLRLWAGLLLIACMWGIGRTKAYALHLRARRIMHLIDGLACMETEVRCLCAPLPDALRCAAAHDPLFAAAADNMYTADAGDAFALAAEEASLYAAEKNAILDFAAGLSAEDSIGQLRNMENCRVRLESILETAKADTARLGRLYSAGGAALGVLLMILLI